MEPITTIATGVSATKAVIDILRGIKGMTDQTKVAEAVIVAQDHISSLQQSLLDAQLTLDTLAKEKRELETQLVNADDWRNKTEGYSLHQARVGLVVYRSTQRGETAGAPEHWACPKCFSNREIQILYSLTAYDTNFKCPNCDFSADFAANSTPPDDGEEAYTS